MPIRFLCAALLTVPAAQAWTWTGGGGTANPYHTSWQNWYSSQPFLGQAHHPFENPTPQNLFYGSGGSLATLELNATVNSVTINRLANFTLDGSREMTINAGGVKCYSSENLAGSTRVHTIGIERIVLGASQTWEVSDLGIILDVSSTILGAADRSLTKTGNGTLKLRGSSYYQGKTEILGGVLEIPTLRDFGELSGIGAKGTIVLGSNQSGTLRLTGSTGSVSNRAFQLGVGNASIDNVGGGPVILNSSPFNAAVASSGSVTLNLGGFNSTINGIILDSINIISGAIQDNLGAAVSLKKRGSNTWALTGTTASNYTGNTVVEDGRLILNKQGATAIPGGLAVSGNGVLQLGGLSPDASGGNQIHNNTGIALSGNGTFRLNGHNETISGLIDSANGGVLENGATGPSTLTITNTTYQTIFGNTIATAVHDHVFSGVLRDGSSGSLALIKNGLGTQTLRGANRYTGGTTVNGGVLILHGGIEGQGMIHGSATVNSGGTLRLLTGNSAFEHRGYPLAGLDSLHVNGGGILELNMRPVYGQYGISYRPAIGSIHLSSANGNLPSVTSTEDTVFPTILRFGSVINGLFTSTGALPITWTHDIVLNGQGYRVENGLAIPYDNNMTFQTAAGHTLNVAGTIADYISGEATPVIKNGDGTLILSGANTYIGGTRVDAGKLVLNAGGFNDGIVHGTVTVNSAATLTVDATGFVFPLASSDTVQLNSGLLDLKGSAHHDASSYVGRVNLKSSSEPAGFARVATSDGSYLRFGNIANGMLTSSGPLINTWNANMLLVNGGGKTMTIDVAADNTLIMSGAIADYSGLAGTPLHKTGRGLLLLDGNSPNTYSGATIFENGTVSLAKSGTTAISGPITISGSPSAPAPTILQVDGTGGNQIADSSIITFHGSGTTAGTLRLSGNSETVGGLASTEGAGVVENNSSGISVLTLACTVSNTFTGILRNGSAGTLALVKTGSGTQTLSGNNTYTGDTLIESGVLSLSTPSLDDGSTITIGISTPSSAVLHLSHSTADRIGSLIIHGSVMPAGLYDSSHPSGAITGSGSLWVGASLFMTWLESHPTLPDRRPVGDSDNDGIFNLLEFVLDGNPNQPNTARMPTGTRYKSSPSNPFDDQYAFTFYRRADSIPEVELHVELSSDLKSWSSIKIEPPGSFMGFPIYSPVSIGAVVNGMQRVTVNIPIDPYNYPQLFARLKATGSIPSGNLLQNGSGASPVTTGWNILANGGDGWHQYLTDGYDATPGYFRTSYGWCRRSQTIDLVAAGFTTAELDNQPVIRVGEAISSFLNSTPDSYYIKVELRDQNQNVIAAWNQGTLAAPLQATEDWVLHQHDFTNYGPGVRYVYFEDGGIDNGFWAGGFGSYHDAASVEVIPD